MEQMAEASIPPAVREIADLVAERIQRSYGPRLKAVYLYGSAARGDYRAGRSDIDLLAVLDDFESHFQEIDRTGEIRQEVSLRFGEIVSIQFLTERAAASAESRLSRALRREGVRLR
jgi:predicted nucleotidyltransferase